MAIAKSDRLRVVGKKSPRQTTLEPDVLWPCNLLAERNLLGSVISDGAQMANCGHLLPRDFYKEEHQVVFEALRALETQGTPIDFVTVIEQLRAVGKLSAAGGQAAVSEVTSDIVATLGVTHYARILLELACEREAMQASADITSAAYKAEGDILGVLTYAQDRLNAIADRRLAAERDPTREFAADDLLAMELPDTPWIVEDVLPEGLSLLAAKQKIGKSWLALSLCLSVSLGGAALGVKQARPGAALYLALEDTPKRLQSRMQRLLYDEKAPHRLTLWTKCPRLDQGGLRKIEGWLKGHADAALIVIDVFGKVRPPRARNGDIYAEDYAVMTPLKALAEQYHCAILVIHHTRKAGAEDVFDEVRDSTGLTGACDTVMVMQRARGEANAKLHVTGRDVDERAYALTQSKETMVWRLVGDAADVERSQERQEVIDYLNMVARPAGPSEMALYLEKKTNAMKVLLHKMFLAGEVVRTEDHRYILPKHDHEQ